MFASYKNVIKNLEKNINIYRYFFEVKYINVHIKPTRYIRFSEHFHFRSFRVLSQGIEHDLRIFKDLEVGSEYLFFIRYGNIVLQNSNFGDFLNFCKRNIAEHYFKNFHWLIVGLKSSIEMSQIYLILKSYFKSI